MKCHVTLVRDFLLDPREVARILSYKKSIWVGGLETQRSRIIQCVCLGIWYWLLFEREGKYPQLISIRERSRVCAIKYINECVGVLRSRVGYLRWQGKQSYHPQIDNVQCTAPQKLRVVNAALAFNNSAIIPRDGANHLQGPIYIRGQ